MRQVLENIPSDADVHLYVRRIARWGWADKDELTCSVIPRFEAQAESKYAENSDHTTNAGGHI